MGDDIDLRSKRDSKGLAPWAVEAAQPPPIIPLPLGGGRRWGNLCTTFLKRMTFGSQRTESSYQKFHVDRMNIIAMKVNNRIVHSYEK